MANILNGPTHSQQHLWQRLFHIFDIKVVLKRFVCSEKECKSNWNLPYIIKVCTSSFNFITLQQYSQSITWTWTKGSTMFLLKIWHAISKFPSTLDTTSLFSLSQLVPFSYSFLHLHGFLYMQSCVIHFWQLYWISIL